MSQHSSRPTTRPPYGIVGERRYCPVRRDHHPGAFGTSWSSTLSQKLAAHASEPSEAQWDGVRPARSPTPMPDAKVGTGEVNVFP